ncbi:hypothetical protein ONZ45_g5179 [Pleurotus djamor]|nr:hypothetical protein ONZ45_g5179 [Pleurotus djamor]
MSSHSHSPIHSHHSLPFPPFALQPLPSAPIKTYLASLSRTLSKWWFCCKWVNYIHCRTCPQASPYQIPSPTTTATQTRLSPTQPVTTSLQQPNSLQYAYNRLTNDPRITKTHQTLLPCEEMTIFQLAPSEAALRRQTQFWPKPFANSARRTLSTQTAGREWVNRAFQTSPAPLLMKNTKNSTVGPQDAAYRRQAQYRIDPFANSVNDAPYMYEQGYMVAGRPRFEEEEIWGKLCWKGG